MLCFGATLLAWVGWISVQVFQTRWIAVEVNGGSPVSGDPRNKEYVEGFRECAQGNVIHAVLLSLVTMLPVMRRSPVQCWCVSLVVFAALLCVTPVLARWRAREEAVAWVALLGPLYGVQNTVPGLLVADRTPADSRASMQGFLNVAVCIPQLLVALGGGYVVAYGGTWPLFATGAVCSLLAATCASQLLTKPRERDEEFAEALH